MKTTKKPWLGGTNFDPTSDKKSWHLGSSFFLHILVGFTDVFDFHPGMIFDELGSPEGQKAMAKHSSNMHQNPAEVEVLAILDMGPTFSHLFPISFPLIRQGQLCESLQATR